MLAREISVLFIFSFICGGLPKILPSYIKVCPRDQATISDCVRRSIEALRPRLAEGLTELGVPSVEPFYIPEIVIANGGGQIPISAVGKDVKVYGASNFTIKSLSVDLDTMTIRARVRFPHLQMEGRYSVDGQLLVLPIKGKGTMKSDVVKGDAELVLKSKVDVRKGVEYLRFSSLRTDISIKDYHIRLDGLFNGDKVLGEATNEAINQNKGEFLLAVKPILEDTVSKMFLNMANQVVDDIAFDVILPKP